MSIDSTLIDEVLTAWHAEWGQTPPIAFRLRDLHPGQIPAVRFHSLPGSKRYAETDAERAEVLFRHHAVLTALAPPPQLIVIWPWFTSDSAPAPSEGVLWKVIENDDYFVVPAPDIYVRPYTYPSKEFDDMLSAAADWEVANVIVGPPDLHWLYHPYDGGADVIAATTQDRDRLRAEFSSWLSTHPQGR